ncbi:MAG: molybdopterin-dependent oxidoreductase [Pyrinomonadaceae bacterium MAG19_C2-C3]|nr:molybdopterin-dependent oxidoreductase [Pyrinomonadaceae bacterium MAG19_C2-C3]
MKKAEAQPFDKHARTIVREREPFNSGAPLDLLGERFITPIELFYVRNHAPVPRIDEQSFRLKIDGMAKRTLDLSLEDLRAKYTKHEVTATLQCAGNRRDDLISVREIPGEVKWGAEALGTATWGGVRLRDALESAGVGEGAAHVEFIGGDEVEKQGKTFGFGGSIPLSKALSEEVLLAFEMNGRALPDVHGAPLRVVVPGYLGARSVKWVRKISVQREASTNYYQAHAYKIFPPHITAENADWTTGLMLGEMSVNAAICAPEAGANMPEGKCAISGYATAGGGRSVERVDVSIDGGASWVEAEFVRSEENDASSNDARWAWRLWTCEAELSKGTHTVIARAFDSAANTQPESAASIWNFKGYMNNAWHRVEVDVN